MTGAGAPKTAGVAAIRRVDARAAKWDTEEGAAGVVRPVRLGAVRINVRTSGDMWPSCGKRAGIWMEAWTYAARKAVSAIDFHVR